MYSKSIRGLGIKKKEDMNRALVAKLTWEVASNAKKGKDVSEKICEG